MNSCNIVQDAICSHGKKDKSDKITISFLVFNNVYHKEKRNVGFISQIKLKYKNFLHLSLRQTRIIITNPFSKFLMLKSLIYDLHYQCTWFQLSFAFQKQFY